MSAVRRGVRPRLLLRMMRWESRGAGGRLFFFVACIGFGVAALVGVDSLVERMEVGLRDNARALLGGDVQLRSRRPLPDVDPYLPGALRDGPRVDVIELPTMATNGAGRSHLVQLEQIDVRRGTFPIAGVVELATGATLPSRLDARSVVATDPLLANLGVSVGDELRLGGARFVIVDRVVRRPQGPRFSFVFGPTLYIGPEGLERAGLLGFGSRVRYRTLLGLPPAFGPEPLARLKLALEGALPGGGSFVEVETREAAQPRMGRTLVRVRHYLGLVALLSLLLGCVGVAQIAATWIARAAPRTAVLRCLGMRPRDVALLHLGQVAVSALLGSVLGGALGLGAPWLAARAYPEFVAPEVALSPAWGSLARGVVIGTLTAALFSLPALAAVYRVSPAAVLRSGAALLPVPIPVRLATGGLLALGLYLAALSQARDALPALAFCVGVAVLAGLLWAGARALQAISRRVPRDRLPAVLWQGTTALSRPGAGTTGSIVALGLGTLVIVGITLVERIIIEEVVSALPRDAPSLFLADVQPDQWSPIEALAREHGADHVRDAPVVMARLSAVNGVGVDALVAARERESGGSERTRARWVLTREQRITFRASLGRGNALVAGALWDREGVAELSLEQDFAEDLGVGVGDRLTLDVQGVPIEFLVSSLREVQWRSFEPNFFLVAEPGSLEGAPRFHIGAMRLPVQRERAFQDAVAARFPNVTLIAVRPIIEQVAAVFSQLALGVRLLGGFAVFTGLVILLGAIAATQLRRAREAALMKALGFGRGRVALGFAWEYALRGLVAGGLGVAGAYGLTFGFTRGVLELQTPPSLWICAGALLAIVALSVVGGLSASARALRVSPMAVFRDPE